MPGIGILKLFLAVFTIYSELRSKIDNDSGGERHQGLGDPDGGRPRHQGGLPQEVEVQQEEVVCPDWEQLHHLSQARVLR